MKSRTICCVLAAVLVTSLATFAFAGQAETGNGAPSGAHFNLNIIGMAKSKTPDPNEDPNEGRRIFVQLGSKDNAATTKILLVEGPEFGVLDYDGTDGQAKFQLPNPDPDNDGVTQYTVYLRVLGKPGGKIRMATSALDSTYGEITSDMSVVSVRKKGQMKFANVSGALLGIYAWVFDEATGTWVYQRIPLFSDLLQDFLWKYSNNGVRLAQLRFYEGVPTQMPDPLTLPHLASISPTQGTVGTAVDVTITGLNLDFNGAANDQTPTVTFGDNIAVNSVTVASDTSMVVQIAIAADAAVGWRPVTVTLADGSTYVIWFQVMAALL